jgi:hypothetical protein
VLVLLGREGDPVALLRHVLAIGAAPEESLSGNWLATIRPVLSFLALIDYFRMVRSRRAPEEAPR